LILRSPALLSLKRLVKKALQGSKLARGL